MIEKPGHLTAYSIQPCWMRTSCVRRTMSSKTVKARNEREQSVLAGGSPPSNFSGGRVNCRKTSAKKPTHTLHSHRLLDYKVGGTKRGKRSMHMYIMHELIRTFQKSWTFRVKAVNSREALYNSGWPEAWVVEGGLDASPPYPPSVLGRISCQIGSRFDDRNHHRSHA